MNRLEYIQAVEEFLGRDIEVSSDEEEYVYEMYDEEQSYQLTAESLMTRADFRRIYGPVVHGTTE